MLETKQQTKIMPAKRNVVILYVCSANDGTRPSCERLLRRNFRDCSTSETASPASNRATDVPVHIRCYVTPLSRVKTEIGTLGHVSLLPSGKAVKRDHQRVSDFFKGPLPSNFKVLK